MHVRTSPRRNTSNPEQSAESRLNRLLHVSKCRAYMCARAYVRGTYVCDPPTAERQAGLVPCRPIFLRLVSCRLPRARRGARDVMTEQGACRLQFTYERGHHHPKRTVHILRHAVTIHRWAGCSRSSSHHQAQYIQSDRPPGRPSENQRTDTTAQNRTGHSRTTAAAKQNKHRTPRRLAGWLAAAAAARNIHRLAGSERSTVQPLTVGRGKMRQLCMHTTHARPPHTSGSVCFCVCVSCVNEVVGPSGGPTRRQAADRQTAGPPTSQPAPVPSPP